jgi:hypothetical protein
MYQKCMKLERIVAQIFFSGGSTGDGTGRGTDQRAGYTVSQTLISGSDSSSGSTGQNEAKLGALGN